MYNLDDSNLNIEIGDTNPLLFGLMSLRDNEFEGSFKSKVDVLEKLLKESDLEDEEWIFLCYTLELQSYYFDAYLKSTNRDEQKVIRHVYFTDEIKYVKIAKSLKWEMSGEKHLDIEYFTEPQPFFDASNSNFVTDSLLSLDLKVIATKIVERSEREGELGIEMLICLFFEDAVDSNMKRKRISFVKDLFNKF